MLRFIINCVMFFCVLVRPGVGAPAAQKEAKTSCLRAALPRHVIAVFVRSSKLSPETHFASNAQVSPITAASPPRPKSRINAGALAAPSISGASLDAPASSAARATFTARVFPSYHRDPAPSSRGLADAPPALSESDETTLGERLARVTAYWTGEDRYTRRRLSSTGIRLHEGACAVDPSVIPYGSVVQIPGVGKFLAVDTGTAVVSRRAAREAGHTRAECNAVVVDLFFESRTACEKFVASGPQYAAITWWKPTMEKAEQIGGLLAHQDRLLLAKTL